MSALDDLIKIISHENGAELFVFSRVGKVTEEVIELRRLVALLTTEPLHITRADIDSAKRILQKAEEK